MAEASSPISQLLKTLGLSKEDLLKHSGQMREFLDAHAPCTDPAAPSSSEPKSELAPTSAASSPPSTPGRKKLDDRKLLSSGGAGTMEAVLERKSKQHKRDRKRRDRERVLHSPSPSMRYTGLPTLSSGRPRDLRLHASMDDTRTTPATNRHYRTYSEARMNVSSPLLQFPSSSRSIYETPRKKGSSSSLLPPSSPPVSSSPVVTPATSSRYHKLVSSPGPLQPLPDESEYENLPFKLPPGPYRDTKPELSYAALIGQAILASPEHRLTLQEIYDFITIVYPYYKRDETTWMNSIRHVLSTTTAFRKQLRERSQGRTLWAIWDCDLDAFKDGGFKKSKCAKPSEAHPDAPPPSKVLAAAAAVASSSSKKRGALSILPDGEDTIKKPKRRRRASSPVGDGDDDGDESAAEKHQPVFSSIPTMHTVPIFAPTGHFVTQQQQQHQHYQKQPYAESWKSMPTMVVFPPIPASLRPATTTASSVVASSSAPASSSSPNLDVEELVHTPRWEHEEEEGAGEKKENEGEKTQADGGKKAMLVATDSFSSISTHTRSSSPLPPELESDDLPLEALLAIESEDDEEVSELRVSQYPLSTSEDEVETNRSQANIDEEKHSPSPPPSPSPAHRIAATQTKLHNSTTPPPPPVLPLLPPMPKTPPPHKEGLSGGVDGSLSASLRTPSTRRFSSGAPGSGPHGGFPALSTPMFAPVTPKKGGNSSHGFGSAGGSTNSGGAGAGAVSGGGGGGGALPGMFDGESPFRTPTSGLRGSLFDPHNPSTLLEEELARYQSGGGMVDSPAGLYGKYKASPGSFGSPTRWW